MSPMSPRLLRPKASGDPDALAYIAAVQTADGQLLEAGVVKAINDFVVGCKADGIWTALKASCILMGARTLSGALTPLVGAAPTNNNFVSGDYDRKTGLKGNASNKLLNTNRNNNADPQNSKHISVYVSEDTTSFNFGRIIIAGDGAGGDSGIVTSQNSLGPYYTNLNNTNLGETVGLVHSTGFFGLNRSASSAFVFAQRTSETTFSRASATPRNENIVLFGRAADPTRYTNTRISFYSIGESLTLQTLRARVDSLVSAIAAAI